MGHVITLALVLPLIGFFLTLGFGADTSERVIGTTGALAVGGSFVASVVAFTQLLHHNAREVTVTIATWMSTGSLHVPFALLLDPLSVTMCLFVTGVSTLIFIYAIGYQRGEADFRKFFLYFNLFVFSMLVLVLANNLLMTFIGWEGVGVCSYFLVSFHFHRESAASAGKKAFLYNRVGDLGLLAAMFLLFHHGASLTYLTIFQNARATLSPTTALLVVLALLFGAAGKSAQIPLFNWLPDAMEGPTPVSALIHAATMVTAGVYLLVRMAPVLALSGSGRTVVAVVGGLTAFVAATIATSQNDIKKVLAFSTVSQIGYMILAVGCGDYSAAIFLMIAHAFFKALLFLSAGSVIHSLDGEQDLRRMGGLGKYLPWTFPMFLIGWLAISGVPPFAGFWAKGAVLSGVYAHDKVLWVLAVLTAVLTAYYMTRLFVLTVRGPARGAVAEGAEPHESPTLMLVPLAVLGLLSLLGGVLDLPWRHAHSLSTFIDGTIGITPSPDVAHVATQWTLAGIDIAAALIGLLAAITLWRGRSENARLTPSFLEKVWHWDDVYDAAIGRPVTNLSTLTTGLDAHVIDGTVETLARRVNETSGGVRRIQTGLVRHYALGMTLGVALIFVYLVAKVR